MAIAKNCDVGYYCFISGKVKIEMSKSNTDKIDPRVKDVLRLLGAGTVLAACIVFPGLPIVVKAAMDSHHETERKRKFKEWERFNLWRLRASLKRLRNQKVVKIVERDGEPIVILTKKGKTRYLKYKLEEMIIKKPPKWDGRWRLVIYDIAKHKRNTQQAFREVLKKLKFFRLQKSVYLYPYPCYEEIEFLRQYYGIGDDVIILIVEGIENESVYKKYFGL